MADATLPRRLPPPLLDDACALFLDVDGTLLEFDIHPDLVGLPRGALDIIGRVSDRLGGALALVSGRPLAEVETSFLGTSHVAVGAYLADVWGLPADVVQAIELHHDATPPDDAHAGVVKAVRLAQAAAECIERGDSRLQGVDLTPEQVELIDEEFALTEVMPKSREPLLAI